MDNSEQVLWFVFNGGNLMLERLEDGTYTIPYGSEAPLPTDGSTAILDIAPMEDGRKVKAYNLTELPELPYNKYEMCGLRQSYYKLSEPLYLKAGKCEELLYWYRNNRYCGVCGTPLEMHSAISKKCPHCGKEIWPQLSTAIIVLIRRGEEVLLVHAHNFKTNFFGLVAGFVETGETLEEAVCREVMEETSLTIKNLRYVASQPWPYPCGLMVGFFADYESGSLHLQDSELAQGGWFHRDHLPTIPEKLSLARKLIDHWLEETSRTDEQEEESV